MVIYLQKFIVIEFIFFITLKVQIYRTASNKCLSYGNF